MKKVLVKFKNGGFASTFATQAQICGLEEGRGIETEMYGFIPADEILSFRVIETTEDANIPPQ